MNETWQLHHTPRRSALADELTSTLRAAARRLMLDRHARFWAAEIGLETSGHLSARVVAVRQETADTRTFELRPSRSWKGHRAGQFTTLGVEIDGVRKRRCYSISSAPSAANLCITVKRVAGGAVSNFLHDHVGVGQVVELTQAAGEFCLPAVTPERLLFIAGGSGVTPILSILNELAGRGEYVDAIVVVYARRRADLIGYEALGALERAVDGLRFIPRLDDDPRRGAGYREAELKALVPDLHARQTFLCGPPGLMEAVRATWTAEGLMERLRSEAFVASLRTIVSHDRGSVAVTLGRSRREVTLSAETPLLDALEAAGERPAFGCMMGICRTCRCRKVSGAVENTLTGVVSDAPDEDIALCISAARSDLHLDL